MGFDRKHPEYDRHIADWRLTKAVLSGKRAVIELSDEVLPKTEAQKLNLDGYDAYCKRASWFGGAAKTLDAWVGTIFRKPMTVEVPKPYQWRLQNIDEQWGTFDEIARRVVRELLAYGRIGVLVDAGNRGLMNTEHGLPYLIPYSADQILNWVPRQTATGIGTGQVILKETLEEPHPDGFGVQHIPIYRVLDLDERGFYRSRKFSFNNDRIVEYPTIYPTLGGKPLTHIPFYIIGPEGLSLGVQKAPLLDVVNANISHFQLSALLADSLHWSASPTAVVTGLSPDDTSVLPVGGGALWKLPLGATASFAEFSGPGVAAIQEAIREEQQRMMLIGSAAISMQKREVETAEALTIRSSGESASLLNVVDSASQALTMILTEAIRWGVIVGDVKVSINRDLTPSRMTPDEIRVLIFAHQSGLITLDTLLHNLTQGEILEPGLSIEDAKAKLMLQSPVMVPPIVAQPSATTRQRDRSGRNGLNGSGNLRKLPNDNSTNTKELGND